MALILVEQKQKQNTVGTADEAERPWTMAAANAPDPLGIHLGPTHLTAAEVTVRGNHLVPVARISGGIEYRQEYLRTLGPSYHPDSSTSDPTFAGPSNGVSKAWPPWDHVLCSLWSSRAEVLYKSYIEP